jgi:prepilin-type N-terminal cleavage/methylation domain-containing protein
MTKTIRKDDGFSLIELLIAVMILGFLAGITTVNLSSTWSKSRLRSTTRDLENWLSDQRRYAMSNNLTCRITIDESKKRLVSTIDSDDSSEPCEGYSSDSRQGVFDLATNFGKGNENLTLSISTNDLSDPSNSARVIRIQAQGFSQHHLLHSNGELKSADLDNGVLELRLAHKDLQQERCVRFIAPIGMTRDGVAAGPASKCHYDNAN